MRNVACQSSLPGKHSGWACDPMYFVAGGGQANYLRYLPDHHLRPIVVRIACADNYIGPLFRRSACDAQPSAVRWCSLVSSTILFKFLKLSIAVSSTHSLPRPRFPLVIRAGANPAMEWASGRLCVRSLRNITDGTYHLDNRMSKTSLRAGCRSRSVGLRRAELLEG